MPIAASVPALLVSLYAVFDAFIVEAAFLAHIMFPIVPYVILACISLLAERRNSVPLTVMLCLFLPIAISVSFYFVPVFFWIMKPTILIASFLAPATALFAAIISLMSRAYPRSR
jgi:hypothetical protein